MSDDLATYISRILQRQIMLMDCIPGLCLDSGVT